MMPACAGVGSARADATDRGAKKGRLDNRWRIPRQLRDLREYRKSGALCREGFPPFDGLGGPGPWLAWQGWRQLGRHHETRADFAIHRATSCVPPRLEQPPEHSWPNSD